MNLVINNCVHRLVYCRVVDFQLMHTNPKLTIFVAISNTVFPRMKTQASVSFQTLLDTGSKRGRLLYDQSLFTHASLAVASSELLPVQLTA